MTSGPTSRSADVFLAEQLHCWPPVGNHYVADSGQIVWWPPRVWLSAASITGEVRTPHGRVSVERISRRSSPRRRFGFSPLFPPR